MRWDFPNGSSIEFHPTTDPLAGIEYPLLAYDDDDDENEPDDDEFDGDEDEDADEDEDEDED